MRRGAILFLVSLSCIFCRGEWVTEIVVTTNHYRGVEYIYSDGTANGPWISIELDSFAYPIDSIVDCMFIAASRQYMRIVQLNDVKGLTGEDIQRYYNNCLQSVVYGVNGSVQAKNMAYSIGNRVTYRLYIPSSTSATATMWMNANSVTFNYSQSPDFAPGMIVNFWQSGTYTAENANARLYRYELRSGTMKILELFPCLDPFDVPCLVDVLSSKAYYNRGTGNFTYGAVTGEVTVTTTTTNRIYCTNHLPPDSASPFNRAQTSLGGNGRGENGTTLRPTAHFDIKNDMEE